MNKPQTAPPTISPAEQLIADSRKEYEHVQQQLKEIEMLIQQTNAEVDRLSQRNAQAANRQKQTEMHLDTAPRSEIQEVYNAAQDAQKRLFMMRGQLEKLQSDQQNFQRYGEHLKKFLEVAGSLELTNTPAAGGDKPGQPPTIVRIIEAQEQERQRLVRQMHDGPAQSLTNLILQAEICERLFDNQPSRARAELTHLKNTVTSTFQKVRDFMFDLRPMMLDDLGLVPALKRYVANFAEKNNIATNLSVTGTEQRFASYQEVAIFRAVQELLTNARLHANASRIQVTLDIAGGMSRATVEDNGCGFDPKEIFAATLQHKTLGLPTQRERLEMLGGKMLVESAPGRGTRVTIEMPITDAGKI